MMYKDISEKFKYYEKNIIQAFINQGIYPSDPMIKQRINQIDLALPILEKLKAEPGETFDAEQYNIVVKSIYDDLCILYQIVNELTVERYIKLKSYVDVHLNELEKKVNDCLIRSKEEVNSTTLGKTILFQTTFNKKQVDNTTVLSLGSINVTHGSKIACFITGNNLDQTNIVFSIFNGTESYRVTPYNLNQDCFKEPHDSSYTVHNCKTDTSYKSNLIRVTDLTPKESNDYYVLGGKNKIMVKQFGETTRQKFLNAPLGFNLMGFDEKSYVDFYILNGKTIDFRMNKSPITSNFPIKNTTISLDKKVSHFFIECDVDFAFDFMIEGGSVYAAYAKALIKDKQLHFSKIDDITDYIILEKDNYSKTSYQVNCELINNSGQINQIKSVYIKELIED